jgi:hypothetical protein
VLLRTFVTRLVRQTLVCNNVTYDFGCRCILTLDLISFLYCIINVSNISFSAHLNILDTFKLGVTIWYQSRSFQIVLWVIKNKIQVVVLFEFRMLSSLLYLVEIDHFDLNMIVRARMSGARRRRGRPRVNQNMEENVNPDANMWAQMMQQNQQMMHLMQQQIHQNA